QLGDGSNVDRSMPVVVSGIADATAVSAGGDHTCAIRTGAVVFCWGKNASGELGDLSTNDSSTPVGPIAGAVSAISAGQKATCAIFEGNKVLCWGDVGYKFSMPELIPGMTLGVVAISVGADHGCALKPGTTVICWGRNDYGQLGNGATGTTAT